MPIFLVMAQVKLRLGSAAVFFLAGALTLLPVSAFASPSSGPTGDDLVGFDSQYQAKDDDKSKDGKSKDGTSKDGKSKDGKSKDGKSKDDKSKDDKCKDDDKGKDDDGSKDDKGKDDKGKDDDGSKDDKCKDDDKGKDDKGKDDKGKDDKGKDDKGKDDKSKDDKSKDPAGRADGIPALNGFGSVDTESLPVHLGAAIVLFQHDDHDQNGYGRHLGPAALAPEPTDLPTNKVSANVIRMLTPVLPPVVVEVVAAPLVVAEALIEAMASSGQALVIPFLVGAAGFFLPGKRRKQLLAEALDPDSDDQS